MFKIWSSHPLPTLDLLLSVLVYGWQKNGNSINDELANGEFLQANAELCFMCSYTFPRWCCVQQYKH
jgi:hypothetical protein